MRLTIEGIQKAQDANLRVIAAIKPSGAFGRAIREATALAHRYAVATTHVDTGALRASHRMAIEDGGMRGVIYLDPSARNPRTGQLTSVYGPYEHRRGGAHAYYERTIDEHGLEIARAAVDDLLRELP